MKKWLCILFLIVFGFSCKTNYNLSTVNLSNIYSKKNNNLFPEYYIHHVNDTTSTIFYQIRSSQLLKQSGRTSVSIKYILYDSFESSTAIDSNKIFIADTLDESDLIVGKLTISNTTKKKYLLKINCTDLSGNRNNVQFLSIDKTSKYNSQNYLASNFELPLFGNYIKTDTTKIELENKTLILNFYQFNPPLPPPPFSVSQALPFDQEPSEILYFNSDNGIFNIPTFKNGIYFFTTEEQQEEGLTLIKYGKDFPSITSIESVIEPMRFITSKKEYSHLSESTDSLRIRFETFWLEKTSNVEEARSLIATYYKRIEQSNLLFSSYIPGWKTDRGIIYLIFGPPNIIKKSSTKEVWTYGEEKNYLSVNFVFNQRLSKFSDNHYILNRSSVYKTHWYRAVDNWRQGKVQ